MKFNRFLLISLFLFLPTLLYAQQYNIQTYSVNKGLPQAQVHDIEQTQDGYIWMATYGGGLARFDGSSFVNYDTDDGLKNNLVEELYVDSNDQLWVATDQGGVARFKGDSLIYPIQNDSLNAYSVGTITETDDGSMWFGTYQGGIFVLKDQQIHRYTVKNGLSSNIIWELFQRKDGTMVVATANGMSVYDGEHFTNYYKKDGLASNNVYNFAETGNNELWIATAGGISVWDGHQFDYVRLNADGKPRVIYDIIQSSNGTIWVATRDNGIYRQKDGDFIQLTEKNGLSSNYMYTLFEDADSNIWIGTDEDGANVFRESGFMLYNDETGLPNSEILSLHTDKDGKLWMGTTSGIQSFQEGTFQKHTLPDQYKRKNIWSIISLPNGNKLVAMPDSTLMEFDGQNFSDFSTTYDLAKLFIYDLMVDGDNVLWIGSNSGLYKLDLNTGTVKHLTEEDGLANKRVFHVYEDSEDRKWVGTYYGLSILDDGEFTTLNVDDGLVHSQINHISEDKQGNIWIGTRGGISVLKGMENNKPKEIDNFAKENGMILLNTHFLWFDNKGALWQGTNGGLQKLDVSTYRKTGNMNITHYPLSDKGIGLEFNFQAITNMDNDHAWMGTMDGVMRLTPRKIEDVSVNNLNITNIKVNSSPVSWSDYEGDLHYHNGFLNFPHVKFPADKNIFEFTFQSISYNTSDNVKYRYRLEGFRDEWLPETNDNTAVFTNLDPGKYTFVVQAKNSHSQWEDNEATYQFSIAAPFWQTYWFYGLLMLFFGVFTYALMRYRMNKWEKEELEQRVAKQTKHLTSALEEKEVLIKEIHHRVKNNLAVISGLLELQMDHADDRFVNRVLSESQRRVQSISMIHEKLYQNERLAEIDFEKYVRELVDIISYSFSNPDKDIKVNISIDDFKLGIDQGIPCGLILNEIVSNAFEHAFTNKDQGKISISISLIDERKVRLTVEDNGKGLPKGFHNNEHESLGLTLVETLGAQLMGTVKWKESNSGTNFILEFEKDQPAVNLPA